MDSVLIIENKPDIVWLSETSINDRINSNHYRSYMTKNELEIKNSGLEVLRIKDIVVKIRRGKGLKKDDSGEIPNYKVRNLTNFGINKDDVDLITHREFVNNKSSHIKIGDVLLASTGVGSLGKVDLFFDDIKATVDGHITILTTKEEYDGGYLKAYLQSRYGQIFIEQNTIGSTGQTELYAKDIGEILIPIPSPKIQKYIGDKVRRAEELREEAKAAKKDYEYIIQDIYSDSNIIKFPKGFYTVQSHDFDDKHLRIDSNFYNPLYKNGKLNSYKNVKLSKLVDLKKNCKIQAEEEYAYFEIGDLSTSNILDGKERVKGSELPGRAKLKLEKDDIIVSLVQESIEVTSYVDKELNNTLTTNGCAVLIPRDKSLSGYLYAIISSKYFIAQKCRYISGTNIRSMSKDDLLDMKIPIVEDEIITKVNGLVLKEFTCLRESKQLILEAKQDVEDLIEGNFEMSKLNNDSSTESRC